jgi:hypothetical protein
MEVVIDFVSKKVKINYDLLRIIQFTFISFYACGYKLKIKFYTELIGKWIFKNNFLRISN